MIKRREFLRNTAVGVFALGVPEFVKAAPKNQKIKINKNEVILFQGDSITDARRKRSDENFNSPEHLGSGYAFLAAAEVLLNHSKNNVKIFNKGVSGNKVYQLAERWEKDCLEIKPTILSILIGVNDFWHMHDGRYDGTLATYKKDFRALLEKTKRALPDVKLIIGEPFALKDVKAVKDSWYPAFNDYRLAAKEIANEYGAVFIPYQTIFDNALKKAPGSYWTTDGVHPTLAGAKLMANAWLEAVGI